MSGRISGRHRASPGAVRKGLRNGQIVNLRGDVCTSGAKLTTDGSGLASILDTFLSAG